MPTPSGRMTAQEKRYRDRERYFANLHASADKLPPEWVAAEAEAFLHRIDTFDGPSYERIQSEYSDEVAAFGVMRAIQNARPGLRIGRYTSYNLRAGNTTYGVRS